MPAGHVLLDDVEENAVDRGEHLEHLFGLGDDIIGIGGGKIQQLPSRALVGGAALHAPVGHHLTPLGVGVGGIVVETDGDIDGRADAGGVQRLDLFAQQIEFETGVDRADFGWVIGVAVVATGKDGDAIHMRGFGQRGELLRVEILADGGDEG